MRPTLLLLLSAGLMSVSAVRAQPAAEASGYVHGAERSRFFALRTAGRPVVEHGLRKYVSHEGVFAVDEASGLTVALANDAGDKSRPNAAPARPPSAPLSPDEHSRRVLDYFLSAGLPREQVRDVRVNTYLSAAGPAERAARILPTIDGYATVVLRKVGEIPVVDSVAWARLGDKPETIAEWVYWPAIPARVVDEARRLAAVVGGPQREAYLSRLPVPAQEGEVVIRHSSPFTGAPVEAFASYDVLFATGSAERGTRAVYVRHFDAEGREFRLPQETTRPHPETPKEAKEATPR